MTNTELEHVAREVRKDILVATHAAKSGHPGGSLSAADILTYLYFEEMNVDPADPHKASRDRFVLSKGCFNGRWHGACCKEIWRHLSYVRASW